MASTNSIQIQKLKQEKEISEKDLALRKDIAQKDFQIKREQNLIEKDKLAEQVRNNLRTYNINLSKNEIERLANDQLNDREAKKLLETMRHNLATELETNRHNLSEEELKSAENAIKRMDSILQAGKPTGRDAIAIMTSYFLNQANLKAFGLDNPDADISQALNLLGNGYYEQSKPGMISYTNDDGQLKGGVLKGQYVSKDGKVFNTKNKRDAYENPSYYKYYDPVQDRWYEDNPNKNEIPEDYTNSSGPGGKNEKFVEQKKAIKASGVGTPPISRQSDTSSNGKHTGSDKRSSVIYSPGTEWVKDQSPYGGWQ